MINQEKHDQMLTSLKQGDERAFSEIYDLFWDKLYYLAYQKLRNQTDAEEVVQDTFLILWKKRGDLTIANLNTYLAAMVRFSVYRHLARKKQSKTRELVFQERLGVQFSIDDSINNKILLEKIFELSNQLPERCRLVFQYNKLEDQPLNDVAETLKISKKTAEAHLTKALKFIRVGIKGFMGFF